MRLRIFAFVPLLALLACNSPTDISLSDVSLSAISPPESPPEPLPPESPADPPVVHEWGTFLAMGGSDGVALDGMYHEEHGLPSFVHARGRDQAPALTVPSPRARRRSSTSTRRRSSRSASR